MEHALYEYDEVLRITEVENEIIKSCEGERGKKSYEARSE